MKVSVCYVSREERQSQYPQKRLFGFQIPPMTGSYCQVQTADRGLEHERNHVRDLKVFGRLRGKGRCQLVVSRRVCQHHLAIFREIRRELERLFDVVGFEVRVCLQDFS